MIEKMQLQEDIAAMIKEIREGLTPEDEMWLPPSDFCLMSLRSSIEMLALKLNEIIDVINGEGTIIIINAVDPKSFDEMIRSNPGSIAKVVDDALKNEDPPDNAE